MSETSGTHNYGYDDIYRLLSAAHPSAGAESYTYDKVGNRLTSATEPSWNYDQNNRLLSYDGVTYNHDNNGNRTSATTTSSLTSYSYDFENRLETVDGGFITYGYAPNGKRLAKTVGGVTTYYLYDGEDVIAEYDATGTLLASYVHGPGIDEPISMTRGGATYYYTFDGLGSVKDLTDSTETLIEQYQYDSFGNLTAPPATGNPYTYTSREYDPETGLLFYRARYYDPATGRFLQQDPKGFDGGDVNFYAYVAGNPINLVDPYGAEGEWIDWVQGGLDLGGLVPGFGEPLDLANAGIYALRGDKCNAALSVGGAIPFAGWLATITKVGKKGGKIVIGEGMARVKDFAKAYDAKWYQAWRKYFKKENFNLEESLRRNERWIRAQIKQGKEIIDIGPIGDQITSPFYRLERQIIEELGYPTTKIVP
jgi:RHS repeat-associated protein